MKKMDVRLSFQLTPKGNSEDLMVSILETLERQFGESNDLNITNYSVFVGGKDEDTSC